VLPQTCPEKECTIMTFLRPQGPSWLPRRSGLLSHNCCLGLLCSMVAVILLAHLHSSFRSDKALDTTRWRLADLLGHLQKRGVKLHVVSVAQNGSTCNQAVYLTEDPDATWLSMQAKMRVVERAQQWHGTVWVGHAGRSLIAEEELAAW